MAPADGAILAKVSAPSTTGGEYPIVADIDGDGHADILLPGDLLTAFTDVNNLWPATRKIWNEHNYHVTNVNDDASVPRAETPSWQTHNTYRVNLAGQVDLTAARLRLVTHGIGQPVTLMVRIGNGGLIPSSAQAVIAFYQGNPAQNGLPLGRVTVPAILPGQYADVSMDTSQALDGTAIYAVVDPDNAFDESDETNNVVSRLPCDDATLMTFSVATDSFSYAANTSAILSSTVSNVDAWPACPSVELRVEDASGNAVADFGPDTLGSLASGSSIPDTHSWDTANTLAGTYVLHGVVRRADGFVMADARAPFSITLSVSNGAGGGSSSTGVTVRLTTDKATYNTTDQVKIGDVVQNVSVNGPVGNATLQLTMTDPNGSSALSLSVPLGQLAPGYLRQLSNLYNLSAAPQGRYTVTGTVLDGSGNVLATAGASFQVVENQGLSITGSEKVQTTSIDQDQPETCSETVSNRGTQNASGLALQLLVINLDTGAIDSQTAATVNVAAGSVVPLSPRTFSTSPLAYGNHACVLQAMVNGSYKTLASAPFVVKQPPVRVSGSESAQSPWVYQGDAQTCTDVVNNTGSQNLPALPVRQQILNTDTGTVDQQADISGNIASGASQTFIRNFTTGSLAIGHHACVVMAQVNGAYQTLGTAPFEVRQLPVRVTGSLGLGTKGRLLVLMDSPTDHGPPLCNTGLVDVSLETDFGQSLSPDATVEVKVLNALGLIVDTETTSLRSFTGEVNLHAGNGIDLAIPSFTADELVVKLAGSQAGQLLGGLYSVVATVSDQTNLRYLTLNSGLVSLTCNVLGSVGSILNNTFTVISLNDSVSNAGTGIGDGPDSKTIPQQQATLSALLAQDGWSYDLVLNKNDFATKFRTGNYQDYALLSEYQVLDPQVQQELREHVYNGEGLLVAGRHDVRTRILDNPLGIQYVGAQLAPTGVQMLAGNTYGLSGQESFTQGNKVQRFLLKGATADGNVLNSIPNGQNSLVTHNAYGNGIAALGGYDLLAETSAETAPGLHSSLIRKPLVYVNPSQANPLAGRVVPLHLSISNPSIPNTTQVSVGTSINGYVVAASAGTVANGRLSWSTQLATGQTAAVDLWVQVSSDGSPVTVTATLLASAGGFTANPVTVTQVLSPTVKPSLTKAINDLTIYAANQPPPGLLGAILDPILGLKTPAAAALDELNQAQTDLNAGNAAKALSEMVEATSYLINDGSTSLKPIRIEVDEAIYQTEKLL
jgi:hypothetical protein